ncbi:hypothetical protein Mapa_001511 [Marchantia paleacea]|nr:hypothetical protein Mapa_001511 [Marchantia paleacea]
MSNPHFSSPAGVYNPTPGMRLSNNSSSPACKPEFVLRKTSLTSRKQPQKPSDDKCISPRTANEPPAPARQRNNLLSANTPPQSVATLPPRTTRGANQPVRYRKLHTPPPPPA